MGVAGGGGIMEEIRPFRTGSPICFSGMLTGTVGGFLSLFASLLVFYSGVILVVG